MMEKMKKWPQRWLKSWDAEEDVGELGQVNNKENDSKYKIFRHKSTTRYPRTKACASIGNKEASKLK